MLTQSINFPSNKNKNWKVYLTEKIKHSDIPNIELNCHDWDLRCPEIILIKKLFSKYGLNIVNLNSAKEETIISAQSLGLNSNLYINDSNLENSRERSNIYFHKATVRSGEHIKSDGDLFVFGDVNPGAMVSAIGNIMIWGRLLGIAHAGKEGDKLSKISALHLRPVQLRIANKVAKGPKDLQVIGLAEQAELLSESIVINPLSLKK